MRKHLTRLMFWFGIITLCACSGVGNAPDVFLGFSKPVAEYNFGTPDESAAWDLFVSDDQQALFQIYDDALEGAVVHDLGYLWSLNNQRYGDTSLRASVQQIRGMAGNGFGLMCRADAQGNGYYFVISSAGRFAILKGDLEMGVDPVQLVEWQASEALRCGEEPNELEAVCIGDALLFFANGRFLGESHDKTFTTGQNGVVLGAVEQTLWVRFDDILFRTPSIISG